MKTKTKCVSLPPRYTEKIRRIREHLGLSSDSEVIRRAIDVYAEKFGVLTEKEEEIAEV